MFIFVYWLDAHFEFARPFVACPKGTQVKLRAWNIEHDELSLSRPMNVFKNYKKHFLKSFRPEQWQ